MIARGHLPLTENPTASGLLQDFLEETNGMKFDKAEWAGDLGVAADAPSWHLKNLQSGVVSKNLVRG